MKMVIENRKYVRFLAQRNTYAAIGSRFTKIGKIINISMGGLAFEYFSGPERTTQFDSTVVIFTEDKLFLEKIPCQMIYNFPKCCSNQAELSNANYFVKRYGLKFMSIPEDQIPLLEDFINHYNRGIAPSF